MRLSIASPDPRSIRSAQSCCLSFLISFACLAASEPSQLTEAPIPWPAQGWTAVEPISLTEYVGRVLQWNESLQVRLLELEIERLRERGERGVFQPDVVGSYEHLDSLRPNTVEQQRQQFTSYYQQRNNVYTAALESLVPTGARIRIGYSLSELDNNLQGGILGAPSVSREYLSFAGFNLVQPLMRNAGAAATMAGIRLAAVTSDIAYQEYRRQMMHVLGRAESYYWQLYFAQEQLRFFDESVAVAENLLNNNRARFRLGNASELDVLEAESGLALRRSRQAEARQRLAEISNSLINLYSSTVMKTNLLLQASDRPQIHQVELQMFPAWRDALSMNPDYLAQRRKIAGEMIRTAYARNQRLPQLDLKTSVGYYGLAESASGSVSDLQSGDWPAWTLGAEMRIPLGSGSRSRYEFDQAQIRQKQAELQLQELETQIINALDTVMRNVVSTSQNVDNYQKVAEFYQDLFETQRRRLELGTIDSQRLLETEEQWFEARNTVVESLVQHERALLELELVKGTLLRTRNRDLSKADLEQRTARLLTLNLLSEDGYGHFLQDLKMEFDRRQPGYSSNTPLHERAIEVLRKTMSDLAVQRRPAPPADHSDPAVLRKALDALHNQTQIREPPPQP